MIAAGSADHTLVGPDLDLDEGGFVDAVREISLPANYWQVAAGSQGRDYAETFLSTGMAFVGGETPEATMEKVDQRDVLVLKRGQEIVAVGEVVDRNDTIGGYGDKEWLYHFDGWHLPAYRYVDWHVPNATTTTRGLTRKTIQKLPQQRHRDLADEILRCPVHEPNGEPPPTKEVSDYQILRHLVAEGLRPDAADQLTNTFRRIRLLADYYYKYREWRDVREHETRSFLVLPLPSYSRGPLHGSQARGGSLCIPAGSEFLRLLRWRH